MDQLPSYPPYLSSLDSLVFENNTESSKNNQQPDRETELNLALWTNAQFTHDIQPGRGILEEDFKVAVTDTVSSPSVSSDCSSSSSNSPQPIAATYHDNTQQQALITYEHLANYLDYELLKNAQNNNSVQQVKVPTQQQPVALNNNNLSHQPLILPKITSTMSAEDITKALLLSVTAESNIYNNAYATNTALQSNTTAPKTNTPSKKEKTVIEEDKRRRNTAASARFRIKKKQREQTMESVVKEMAAKSSGLENRVKELELEIKWLRGLLIEKEAAKQQKDTPSSPLSNSDN